jgi:tetratricopeptide (TPR) repeat protein
MGSAGWVDAVTVLEVAIGPGQAPGSFIVEVVRSAAGEASAVVELDAEALLARQRDLQRAVLASAVRTRRLLPETEQTVRDAGRELFAALLGCGDVAGRYRASAAVAAERGRGLRVVLRTGTAALAELPWEAMYDDVAGAYVCRHEQLVRHVPVASVPAPLGVRPPLRILGVVSSPRGLSALDADRERDLLTRALARPAADGLAELHWAESATWDDLHDLLLGGQWHVLHFVGHGDFDPAQDEGVLALTGPDGRADFIEAHRFTDLLRQARPMPRLIVLNSCSGAAIGASDLFSGTAVSLVRGGVSAVTAMQFQISDTAAVAFTRGFYSALAHGRGIDDAVSSGRIAILGTSSHTLEWLTPVLYLRGDRTQLFTRTESPSRPAPSPDSGGSGQAALLAPDSDVRNTGSQYAAAWSHSQLAGALRMQRRYREAETAAREAIRLDPADIWGHGQLGATLLEVGRYPEAETSLREAIRLDPANAWAHSWLAGALRMQGRYREAETAAREAIRLDPANAWSHSQLAGALRMQGRYREAETAAREAIRLDPANAWAHNWLSAALLDLGRYREAETAAREAIRLDPANAWGHSQLGDVLHAMSQRR